jgi:hypothetical protein
MPATAPQWGLVVVGFVNVFAAHQPAAQKAARLIIQLLGDFLTDQPPVLRLRFDHVRIDHFFHYGQVLRQSRFVLRARRSGWFGQRRRRGLARRSNALRLGLKQQLQLSRVQPFAAGTKNPAHQRVDLLSQERVLLAQQLVLTGQFQFALGHAR